MAKEIGEREMMCRTRLDKMAGSVSVVGIFYILAKYVPEVIRDHFLGVFLFLTLAFLIIFSEDGTFLKIEAGDENTKNE